MRTRRILESATASPIANSLFLYSRPQALVLKSLGTIHGALDLQISLLNKTVLIAEADFAVARQLRRELAAYSAAVEIESNGSRAIDRALNRDFDLMILAANLPVASGTQVLTLCRQQSVRCPAIALVEPKLRSDRRVAQQILKSGFAAVIDYGMDDESLRSAIRMAIPRTERGISLSALGRCIAGRIPRFVGP